MANNANTTTPQATYQAIPLWIRLLLLLSSWLTPLLLPFSPALRETYTEGLQEFTHHSLPASPPPPPTTTTFHHFPLLPPELRLRIWSLALPPPRLLPLRLPRSATAPTNPLAYLLAALTIPSSRPSNHPPEQPQPHIFTSPVPPPALLAVNAEARAEALRHYQLGLAPDGYAAPRVYVDFARDGVVVSDAVMGTHAGRNLFRMTGDLARVRVVCVPEGGVAEGGLGRGVVAGLRAVVVVRDGGLGRGVVPAWAASDFWGWVRWVEGRGRAWWIVGGPGVDGDEDGGG